MPTLEQLAEKLDGNYWEKGNLQRVYLDRGHNTRKMSTKTFIWQDENGDFKVSCRIDCPSQGWAWINSQQDSVKESVMKEIEDATATEYHLAKKKGTDLYFDYGNLVEYKEVIDGELYPNKERLLHEMDNCGEPTEHFEFITISREELENSNKEEVKKVFDLSVKEIREYQVKNLTGGFQTDANLAQNIYDTFRYLEKQDKDDKYLRSLKNPLAILFLINAKSKITIVGTDTQYSFWKIEKGEIPMPIASNTDETYWCYEIYEGSGIEKATLDSDKVNPRGEILHTYEAGYFNR